MKKQNIEVEGGSLLPDWNKIKATLNLKDKKKITLEHRPYTAVQSSTYVAPKGTIPLKLKEKQQFNPREQPVLRADTRTEQQRKTDQEYTESVLNPSISTQIRETFQLPLRWIANPVKGVGDIVSVFAPNSALAKDLPNTNEDIFEYRKKQLNPYTSNKEKLNNTINEVIPLTSWALLNTLPIGVVGGNMIKSGKNLIKPVVGKSTTTLIKKGVESTGELLNKSVQNAYKLNPYALKENPTTTLYRARPIGQTPEMNMAAQLRAKQAAGEELKWYQRNLLNPQTDPNIIAREKYHGQWFTDNPSDLDFYINPGTRNFADDAQIEILKARMSKSEAAKYSVKNFEDAKKLSNLHNTEFILPKDMIQQLERYSVDDLSKLIKEHNEINKPHWLKGYKEVPNSKANFKSEIDWGKWNKEIPNNKSLMKEYNTIEQQAKANGTWMKNPDGTDFPGTPEQFVQQNSSNFKNAFGNTKVLVNGRPQILTHNSPDTFSEFSLSKVNNGRLSGDGVYTFEEGALWKGIPEHFKKTVRYPANIDQSQYGKIEYHLYGNSTNPKIGKGQFDDITKDIVIDSPTSTRVIDDINRKNIHIFPNTNQLKSAIGNNGMFDMTNPNIYKGLIPPALIIGYLKSKTNEDEKSNSQYLTIKKSN